MNYIAMPGLRKPISLRKLDQQIVVEMSDKIITHTVTYFGISLDKLKSQTRKRDICYVRQVCMYLMCTKTNLTLNYIGTLFGGRDHTSVIHSKKHIEDLMYSDPKVKIDIKNISEHL
jgi:chromosomal replication initiator protein